MEQNQIKFLSLDDMWGMDGRLGRLHYMLLTVRIFTFGMLLMVVMPMLANLISGLGVTLGLAHVVCVGGALLYLILVNISVFMRRMQDLGFAYWWVLIILLVSILIQTGPQWLLLVYAAFMVAGQLALAILPGNQQDNAFGAPVENPECMKTWRWMKPATQGIAVFGFIFIVVAVCGFMAQDFLPESIKPSGIEKAYQLPR